MTNVIIKFTLIVKLFRVDLFCAMGTEEVRMRDIAEAAGVSVNAVSLALRGRRGVSSGTRDRIAAIAADMGYRVNPLVSALMASRKKSRENKDTGLSLGYVTSNHRRNDWKEYESLVRYYDGARQRAAALGYRLELYWYLDPGTNPARLLRILRTRNVQGLIFAPAPRPDFSVELDCGEFSCVHLETSISNPPFHRIVPDQRHAVCETIRHVKSLGYSRIGLVLREYSDRRADLTWTSSFAAYHRMWDAGTWIPPLIMPDVDRNSETNHAEFILWYKRYSPDVVVTLDTAVYRWMLDMGLDIPQDAGLAFLELPRSISWACGIDRGGERIGAAAADLVVSMINRNERGVPETDNMTQIKGVWADGGSLRTQRARR